MGCELRLKRIPQAAHGKQTIRLGADRRRSRKTNLEHL